MGQNNNEDSTQIMQRIVLLHDLGLVHSKVIGYNNEPLSASK